MKFLMASSVLARQDDDDDDDDDDDMVDYDDDDDDGDDDDDDDDPQKYISPCKLQWETEIVDTLCMWHISPFLFSFTTL